MKNLETDQAQLFEAFIKSTQYIVRLKTQQDILTHVGKFILTYFPSDWVAFISRDSSGTFEVQNCSLPEKRTPAHLLQNDVLTMVADVQDSGFLTSRVITVPEPTVTAFIPITDKNRTNTVMLIGHTGTDPLSKELLNVYLAVAGLAGATTERLSNERELNNHRTHLEELVKERTTELERSNKELEQFAYVASHDLQEPLRMVASFTGLLEKRYKDIFNDEAREFMCHVVDGALRMQRLINDLLAFSRVGQRNTTRDCIDCNRVFEHSITNLMSIIEETHACVTSDPLPAVNANETMLVQLFQNLIGNAIKFHKNDEVPQVHVSATRTNDEWMFSVRDNGIGIDSKYYERIFTIFQRLHTRQAYPGTGIGLAICKKIVEMYNGRIWIESQPGNGSTFYFTLPVC
ncbi:MAG: ATP-binding protein [Endomicrobiales bacterium]|jgi:signal transduction histidine kinase